MRLPVFRRSATNEPKHLSRRDMKRRRRRAHVRVAIVQLMTFLLCAQALLGTGVPQAMAADAAERAQWNETVAGIAKANVEERAKDARAQGAQAQANNGQEQGAGKNASGGG